MSKKTDKNIDEIMENFDWGGVHKVMQAMDWCWASSKAVPTNRELKAEGRRLLKEVAGKKKGFYIGTGGLFAFNLGGGNLRLLFAVDWWDTVN